MKLGARVSEATISHFVRAGQLGTTVRLARPHAPLENLPKRVVIGPERLLEVHGTPFAFCGDDTRRSGRMWLDAFAHVRPRDAERLGAAGIRNADDLLDRLTTHARLMMLARESGIDEQRLLSFAVQAQFLRLRTPAAVRQAS